MWRAAATLQRFPLARGDHAVFDRLTFTEAVTTSFRALIVDNPGRRVAAFCHGMVTAVWFAHVLGLDHGPTQFIPDYCGVSRFLASPAHDTVTIRSFNEVGHLGDTFIPLF